MSKWTRKTNKNHLLMISRFRRMKDGRSFPFRLRELHRGFLRPWRTRIPRITDKNPFLMYSWQLRCMEDSSIKFKIILWLINKPRNSKRSLIGRRRWEEKTMMLLLWHCRTCPRCRGGSEISNMKMIIARRCRRLWMMTRRRRRSCIRSYSRRLWIRSRKASRK